MLNTFTQVLTVEKWQKFKAFECWHSDIPYYLQPLLNWDVQKTTGSNHLYKECECLFLKQQQQTNRKQQQKIDKTMAMNASVSNI